jgi:hypothetical protein
MSLSTWLQTISAGLAILGAAGLGVRWLIRHYLSELRPNHGSSLNDKIQLEALPLLREVRDDLVQVRLDVAEFKGRFEEHLRAHNK